MIKKISGLLVFICLLCCVAKSFAGVVCKPYGTGGGYRCITEEQEKREFIEALKILANAGSGTSQKASNKKSIKKSELVSKSANTGSSKIAGQIKLPKGSVVNMCEEYGAYGYFCTEADELKVLKSFEKQGAKNTEKSSDAQMNETVKKSTPKPTNNNVKKSAPAKKAVKNSVQQKKSVTTVKPAEPKKTSASQPAPQVVNKPVKKEVTVQQEIKNEMQNFMY